MKFWHHYIKRDESISYPLIENNILSIGFSGSADAALVKVVSDANNEKDARQAFKEYFKNKSGFDKSLWLKWQYNSLEHFICGMKKGDWVVVPLKGRLFSVYQLLTDRPLIPAELDAARRLPPKSEDGERLWVNDNGRLCKGDKGDNVNTDLGFFREVEPIAVNMERSKYADASLAKSMIAPRWVTRKINRLECSVKRATAQEMLDRI